MYSIPMRSIIVLLILASTLASCGKYQRVLKQTDISEKYNMADSLFKAKKYKKSLRLYEQVVPAYRGKPQAERVQFLFATNYYLLKDYFASSYEYDLFAKSFPASDSAEVAAFRSVESYYHLSRRYTLDQSETEVALEKIQDFLSLYTDSEYNEQANELSAELQARLDLKEFSIAKQYLRIMDYKAAIAAFDNFIKQNPGSDFQEEAYLRRIEAAYLLAKNSLPSLVKERMIKARDYNKEYNKYYKESGLLSSEAEAFSAKIEEALIKEG